MTQNPITANTITANAITANAIIGNAIVGNAMTGNAMTANAMTGNALANNTLDPAVLSALQDPGSTGGLTRQFVKYVISCALDPGDWLSFSWTDTDGVVHQETYEGQLGFASEWAKGPLNLQGQRMVSACLAARTNWFWVPVSISARSSYRNFEALTEAGELGQFPFVEGAFWGNLFEAQPYLKACHIPANAVHSREALRECSAGHLEVDGSVSTCGLIQLTGDCGTVCTTFDAANQTYGKCADLPGRVPMDAVITTSLR